MSGSLSPYQPPESPRARRWYHSLATSYEGKHGPLPDVVSTAGAHLVPRPSTPALPCMSSEAWAHNLHLELRALAGIQECRRNRYGEEVAEEWPISHTPPEIRGPFLEKVRRAQEEMKNLQPTPEDEEYWSDGPFGRRRPEPKQRFSSKQKHDLSSTSKCSESTKPSSAPCKSSSNTVDSPVKIVQQPSPPSERNTPESINIAGKKRKEASPTSPDTGEEYPRSKRRRTEGFEIPTPSSLEEVRSVRAKPVQKTVHPGTAIKPLSLQLSQNAGPTTASWAPDEDIKSSYSKRKRIVKSESISTSPKQDSGASRPRRKRTREVDVTPDLSERDSVALRIKRKRTEEPTTVSTINERSDEGVCPQQEIDRNQFKMPSTKPTHSSNVKLTYPKHGRLLRSQFRPIPYKEEASPLRKTHKITKASGILKQSNKTNKSFRSRLKSLAKTGVAAQ